MTERTPRALVTALMFVAALAACAQVGRPPGGAVDDTPPELSAVEPGSLAVNVDPQAELRMTFSEKVDRRGVARALRLVPDVGLRKPSIEDLDVVFRPLRSWPADTVVVWTVDASLTDRHRVKMKRSRSGAFTTGSSFPPARIVGQATVRDSTKAKWGQLRARLSLPPAEGSRRPTLWREASGSRRGSFELSWLQPGSGPFELKVFLDANGDGRPGDDERRAERDSVRIAPGDSLLDLGDILLLDRKSPVEMVFCVAANDTFRRRVWTASADEAEEAQSAEADSNGCAALSLAPGEYRWGAWIDLDGDGQWGLDSTGVVEPRLEPATFTVEPELPDTLRSAGDFARPDSLESIIPESLHAERP